MISKATFQGDKASRYLQRLCKHFGHKVEVEFDERKGHIALSMGACDLEAVDSDLMMRASAENVWGLARLEHVVESHLERFAFRKEPKITWTRDVS